MALSQSLFLLSSDLIIPSFTSSTARTSRFSPATTPRIFGLRSWSWRRSRRWPERRPTAAAVAPVEDLALRPGEDLPEDYASRHPAGDPSRRRRAGVLLHPTSLPGPYGIGDLGDEAVRFLDWLHSAGCSVWQV